MIDRPIDVLICRCCLGPAPLRMWWVELGLGSGTVAKEANVLLVQSRRNLLGGTGKGSALVCVGVGVRWRWCALACVGKGGGGGARPAARVGAPEDMSPSSSPEEANGLVSGKTNFSE